MTAPEWRDCADPDELAAAVAAGVEVLRMRGGGWVPSALTHRDDFAWFLTHGTRYQLPASWTWRPEPTPEPDDLRERIARAAAGGYMRVPIVALDGMYLGPPWLDVADAVLAVLPTPLPVPPWPGAVLSGLVDEDGVPTWLAQAGQVRGEQARCRSDLGWDDNDEPGGYIAESWVEVRAPRAVPELATERVPVWEAMVGERTAISPDGTPMELSHGDVLLYTNNDGMGGFLMYDDAGHAKEKRPLVAPDGTVEVLKATP